MMKHSSMRLDKFLVEMGIGSRSQVKEMAKKGRIRVNGAAASDTSMKISPQQDMVEADGRPVAYAAVEYYMLNKPAGVVSATEDSRYPVVTDLIETAVRRDLFPVGRLDLDTEGLLLLTNDGDLAHRLLSPRRHVDKVYEAVYEGIFPKDGARRFEEGIILEDGTRTLPAHWKQEGDRRGLLTIQEGKFHQVKRMMEVLGCRVTYLKRLSMGSLKLDAALKPGDYRPLTSEELEALKKEGAGKEQET